VKLIVGNGGGGYFVMVARTAEGRGRGGECGSGRDKINDARCGCDINGL